MNPQPRPLSNLNLQALLFFEYYFTGVYVVLALVIYIYKAATFYYPPHTLAPEVVGILLMSLNQFMRIHVASLWFLGLTIPSLILIVFYLAFQTFVYFLSRFWADLVNNIFLLFFVALESILMLTSCFSFKKAHSPVTEVVNNKPEIGNNTWSLLHSIAAHCPEHPTDKQKRYFQDFFESFPFAYPCRPCAKNFQKLLEEHPVKVDSRVELSIWLCKLHNLVNQTLNKAQFSCTIKSLDERWRKGPAGCYEDPSGREEEYFSY